MGRGILVESSKEVGPWRERMALAAHEAMKGQEIIARGTAAGVSISFFMPKPASAPKTKKIAAVKRPDIDKLARAALDALTDVCFEDDSQVVNLHLYKRYAGGCQANAGAHVHVYSMEPHEVCP